MTSKDLWETLNSNSNQKVNTFFFCMSIVAQKTTTDNSLSFDTGFLYSHCPASEIHTYCDMYICTKFKAQP